MDRVYLDSSNVVAVLDHERKRTFVIRKEGLPDVGKCLCRQHLQLNQVLLLVNLCHLVTQTKEHQLLYKKNRFWPRRVTTHIGTRVASQVFKLFCFVGFFFYTIYVRKMPPSASYTTKTNHPCQFWYCIVVWNPWEKKSKSVVDLGDEEYKQMLCVDGAAVEKPITLKPGEEWTGRLELSVVPST